MAQIIANNTEASFLNDEKREYFKTCLNQMLYDVLKDDRKSDRANLSNDKLPDPSDRATAESALFFSHRMQERNRGLIRKIEEALERIDDGTFGICEECEEEISESRLKARPITTLCIECKRKQEAYEKFFES